MDYSYKMLLIFIPLLIISKAHAADSQTFVMWVVNYELTKDLI